MKTPPQTGTALFRNLSLEKREKVLNAAIDEFATKGYSQASMNSLVKLAGISKGSLFLYFRTKGDLFDCVVEMATEKVTDYLRVVRDETAVLPFIKRIENLIRSGFLFIDSHPRLARIYFHLLQSGEAPFHGDRGAALHRRSIEFLSEFIVLAKHRLEIRADLDVECAAFLLNALLEQLLRAYFTEHIGSGLGLYKGDQWELERWVSESLVLVETGLSPASRPARP
jgi:TetR/AcrR family transcriptional regulator